MELPFTEMGKAVGEAYLRAVCTGGKLTGRVFGTCKVFNVC